MAKRTQVDGTTVVNTLQELGWACPNAMPATWWLARSNYVVPGRLVKAGRNVITVRLFDRFKEGGFVGNGGLPNSLGDEPGHQAIGVGNGGLPMSLRHKPEGVGAYGYYSPDYRTDFPMGDSPYRYYRW